MNEIRKDHLNESYFVNFDDERFFDFTIEDFQTMYELLIELYGERDTFFFDEIQNIQGWERFVIRLHDDKKKVYVTGSNASMLSRELGTHLTGRHLPKMSL
ncbi:AAA family ATPase [Methanolobus psychrotolerans]|uniref:AAA family ATPase n=1 Tax=Methanolobus psychrotolerans TaxID=1874706 RepID=UPI001F5CAB25|nr:AAA family ATPase [Methanolobus psychrotolerans]